MTPTDSSARAEASLLLNLPTYSLLVMAGLDPAIHVFGGGGHERTWMPGTSPGMTSYSIVR